MPSPVLTSEEFAWETYNKLVNRHENRDQHIGRRTGLTELDMLFGGLQKTWYVAISGKAGQGKTAFLTTIMYHFGLQKVKFLTNVLEESVYQIGVRMFSLVSEIDRVKYRDLRIGSEKNDWKRVVDARNLIAEFNGLWTSRQLDMKSISAVVDEHKPDFILVDYLQLMSTRGMGGNRAEQVSAISGYLKGLTLRDDNPVGVIVASQEADEGHMAWSKDIERDADIVISIRKPADAVTGSDINSRRELILKKSRHSRERTTPIEVRFNGALSLLSDLKQMTLQEMVDKNLDRPAPEVHNA